MLKKFTKFLLLTLIMFVVSTSSILCFAHEEDEHTNAATSVETIEEQETTTEDSNAAIENIHTGDLFLFGNDIIMDKLVDGNVFIIGNTVKITGQVNGSLYVIANTINFDGALIRYSIFACANHMYYNNSGTYENNMYVIANNLDATYTSYVARDLKALVSNITLKSAIGRDADLICNTLDLGTDSDVALIYGDLRYTAKNELVIPDNAVSGSTTYSNQNSGNNIINILIGFGTCIVTALSAFIILSKLTPKFVETISNTKLSVLSLLKAFGIGLATIAIVTIFMILLASTGVGIQLATILGLLLITLCIIATPVFAIVIANILKSSLKLEKITIFYLELALISSILHGIAFIPVLGLIINITAIGLIVNVFLPHKELSEEEKLNIEESKKQAKENKLKLKQEKAELKAAKNEEKAKAKAIKKEEKIKVKNDKKQLKEKNKQKK